MVSRGPVGWADLRGLQKDIWTETTIFAFSIGRGPKGWADFYQLQKFYHFDHKIIQ